MTRILFIEMALRQIYGGQPSDDSSITINLVNVWLEQAIAIAAKKNYADSIQLDGIGYVNNSFYTTFKGLTISADENFVYKVTLPQIPFGIGTTGGISTLQIKDTSSGQFSLPIIWLSQAQRAYCQTMRPIPNKILAYSESEFVFLISTIILTPYTATVTMISGGDSTNLSSTLNVPSDYWPAMVEYIKQQLMFERMSPVDNVNDGSDAVKTV